MFPPTSQCKVQCNSRLHYKLIPTHTFSNRDSHKQCTLHSKLPGNVFSVYEDWFLSFTNIYKLGLFLGHVGIMQLHLMAVSADRRCNVEEQVFVVIWPKPQLELSLNRLCKSRVYSNIGTVQV